jgi:hypothetical protein
MEAPPLGALDKAGDSAWLHHAGAGQLPGHAPVHPAPGIPFLQAVRQGCLRSNGLFWILQRSLCEHSMLHWNVALTDMPKAENKANQR